MKILQNHRPSYAQKLAKGLILLFCFCLFSGLIAPLSASSHCCATDTVTCGPLSDNGFCQSDKLIEGDSTPQLKKMFIKLLGAAYAAPSLARAQVQLQILFQFAALSESPFHASQVPTYQLYFATHAPPSIS